MKKITKTSETRRRLLKGIASLPFFGGIGIATFGIGTKSDSALISKENLAYLKKLKGLCNPRHFQGGFGKIEIHKPQSEQRF